MTAAICLPVLRELEVRNYPLYPGVDASQPGFTHSFLDGANLIVGINGLGKTTLLNILLRMLVGPFDPQKGDRLEPGSKLHDLTLLKRFNYFAARIGDDARQATARLLLEFNDRTLVVTRSLGPELRITELIVDGVILENPDHHRFIEAILDLSKVQSDYDWDFVVRNLLFFTEDKVALIWNPKGQFEILRILFLPKQLSKECAELQDDIMTRDSLLRNTEWQVTLAEGELAEILKAAQENETQGHDLVAMQRQVADLATELEMAESTERDISEAIETLQEDLFKREVAAHDAAKGLELERARFFRNSFPGLPAVTEVVLGRLFSGTTCIVCHNDAHAGRERLDRLTHSHLCPVCESPTGTQRAKANPAELSEARLRKREVALQKELQEVEDGRARLQELQSELRYARELLYRVNRTKRLAEHALELALAKSADPTSDVAERRAQVADRRRGNDLKRSELSEARKKYGEVLEKARTAIAKIAEEIVQVFTEYAKAFLVEECALSYKMHKRPIGQSGVMLNFPSFELDMTSSVLKVPSRRQGNSDVSESQKEFIDLAFRMSILTAISKESGSMLVIETPESSLDSMFIYRAGKMLHKFARGTPGRRNQVIATSNLNRENMIPAILGLTNNQGQVARSAGAAVEKRVLNLLKLAAPSRAYLQFKAEYDSAYDSALGR